MTPKQRVLLTYPAARCLLKTPHATFLHWWVYPDSREAFSVGAGKTARDAWANAAQQIMDRTADKNSRERNVKTPKKKKAPIDRLADAYRKRRGIRFTAQEVQALVITDNALQSLIEEWYTSKD